MRAPFSGAPKVSLTAKALTACAAATLALGLGVGTASALPPGGAKASTPGTSSTVSSSVSEHGVISFSVSGFPANTVVSVKVDDGSLCPSDAAQGACVVHQQVTDGNGNVSGSFILPDVGAGTHTLRFLATGEKHDKDGKYLGTEAYSNRSPEFTVVGEGGSDNSSNSSGSSSNRGSSSSKSNGGSSNGGSNSNSSDSADDAQGSNDSNESSANGGSNGSAGGAADTETVYTDADGNTITKEEYDRLNAEAASGSSAAPAASASAGAQKKATASASASSSAVARGTASSPSASASNSANTASTVQTVTYGAAFPWVGVVVLGVSLVAAAVLLVARKR